MEEEKEQLNLWLEKDIHFQIERLAQKEKRTKPNMSIYIFKLGFEQYKKGKRL